MSDNNEKKTLSIKSGTLGISRDKLSLTGQHLRTQSSSKGKVVVVTKARGATRSGQFGGGDESLTEAERLRRLEVIKQAEANKAKEEEERRKLALNSERLRAENNKSIPSATAETEIRPLDSTDHGQAAVPAHVETTVAKTVEESIPAAPVKQAPVREVRKISLDQIMGQGKIRNLDSLYRAPKEPEPEAEEPASTKLDKETHSAPKNHKLLPTTSAKKAQDDEREAANARRAAEAKGRADRKISVAQVMMMDSEETVAGRRRSMASIMRAREKAKRKMFSDQKSQDKVYREVNIPDFITVQELSNRMTEKTADVIKALMKLGMMVTMNQAIDADTAEIIVNEFGHKVKRVTEAELESALLQQGEDSAESLLPRPPVVTVMGHVDHGKTSLLDALRQTDIAAGEAGGITQHIGAYQVKLPSGQLISFLDTPGHEAFTAMRMRGAKVTDIVVLVVAADDGIMQQTIEAISHAKAAGVPIIVAINKIDKPDADPLRVKNELLQHDLVPDDMGGDVMVVEVSAKKKINLDKLEETILLQAEMLDLKANPNRPADGAVVEAKVEKGMGVVATVLVQRGTIRTGDIVVAGSTWGKIRGLINDKGQTVTEALPSTPIEILGLEGSPTAGDDFIVVGNEKNARDIVSLRLEREKQKRLVARKSVTLEQMFKRAKSTGTKELPVIVKADVQGSVEAIVQSLEKLSGEEISTRVIHSAVGGITESDVTLATASGAIILGFNVRANQQARELSRVNGIDIRYYSIIYNLVDDIKAAMSGMLSPTIKEEILGYVEIREVYNLTKFGKVAGCYVTEGLVKRAANARIIRDSVVIFDGKLKALKRFKDDVREVASGFECGLTFENYEDIKVGDRVEVYELTEHQRTL